ncbi:MAG: hypothetical protein K0Q84_3194 [Arthrobacter sp.]|nr:hypothetical protein [Arthrobacter sp.]
MDQAAGLGQVPAEQFAGVPEVPPGCLGRPGTVRRLEQEQAAGQPLGDGVVDLPGYALAFRDGPRPPLTGGQFPLGARHFRVQAALLRGVVLNAVIDQRQHGAYGERPEQHGQVSAVAEAEQPDGGSGRRRSRGHVRNGSRERCTAEEERREGAPGEARSGDDQHGPERNEGEHPDRPGPSPLGQHRYDGVEKTRGCGQAQDKKVVRGAVAHHVADHGCHHQHSKTKVDGGIYAAEACRRFGGWHVGIKCRDRCGGLGRHSGPVPVDECYQSMLLPAPLLVSQTFG